MKRVTARFTFIGSKKLTNVKRVFIFTGSTFDEFFNKILLEFGIHNRKLNIKVVELNNVRLTKKNFSKLENVSENITLNIFFSSDRKKIIQLRNQEEYPNLQDQEEEYLSPQNQNQEEEYPNRPKPQTSACSGSGEFYSDMEMYDRLEQMLDRIDKKIDDLKIWTEALMGTK